MARAKKKEPTPAPPNPVELAKEVSRLATQHSAVLAEIDSMLKDSDADVEKQSKLIAERRAKADFLAERWFESECARLEAEKTKADMDLLRGQALAAECQENKVMAKKAFMQQLADTFGSVRVCKRIAQDPELASHSIIVRAASNRLTEARSACIEAEVRGRKAQQQLDRLKQEGSIV